MKCKEHDNILITKTEPNETIVHPVRYSRAANGSSKLSSRTEEQEARMGFDDNSRGREGFRTSLGGKIMKRFTIYLVVSIIALLSVGGMVFGAAAVPVNGLTPEGGIPSDASWFPVKIGGSDMPIDLNLKADLQKEYGFNNIEEFSAYMAGTTEVGAAAPSNVNTLDKLEKQLGTNRAEAVSSYLAGLYGSK
jgi:hypothetical protein